MLKTETNTPPMEDRIYDAAKLAASLTGHVSAGPYFVSGRWQIHCLDCGARWSVVDVEGGSAIDGFDFKYVSDGDGWCEEH